MIIKGFNRWWNEAFKDTPIARKDKGYKMEWRLRFQDMDWAFGRMDMKRKRAYWKGKRKGWFD